MIKKILGTAGSKMRGLKLWIESFCATGLAMLTTCSIPLCDEKAITDSSGLWSGKGAVSIALSIFELYKKWFVPIFVINLILFFLASDEKKKGIAKGVLIGSVVIFVVACIGPTPFVTMFESIGTAIK